MNSLLIWEVAPTKSEIEMYADNVAKEVAEGFTKPEDLAIKMAAIETFAKTLRTKVEEHVVDFLSKCPKGAYSHLGAELKLKDSQTYDYAAYSEKWAELQAKIDILKEEQKEIEDNGKKFERGIIPLKSYKQTYSITLNK
jgi:hypothetical protein